MVSRTVLPRAASERISAHISRRASMSRPTVGSSRKMRSGSPARAMPKSTRCFCPPEELSEKALLDALETGGLHDVGVGHGRRVIPAEEGEMLAHAQHFRRATDLQHHAGAQPR